MSLFRRENIAVVFACIVAGCGSDQRPQLEGESVEGREVALEPAEVLSLALAAEDYFCPEDFAYNATSRLCESATEAAGPFTLAMIEKCKTSGGGTACSKDAWSRDFARKLRGTTVCPPGATRHTSGLCIEGSEAFGPFSKAHVKNCQDRDGGPACETMRWGKDFAIATLPVESGATPTEDKFTFPFSGPADEDYVTPPRSFGACRDGCARRHAGADLYGPIGRAVYAVGDGEVLDFYYFYDGTYALVVDHGDFVVRYGEVKATLPTGIAVGARVVRGQKIATVGDLSSLSYQMLHFERFSGQATGPLTVRSNAPYQRRSDLVNPTADLLKWRYPR